jgi:adenylosuccinate lyase
MKTWNEGKNFLSELKTDTDVVARLRPDELEAMFDLDYHLKNADVIFARVFGDVES